ncbi:hypothetical protein BDR26DRAFT_889844 [Obelidium mucronatum]|nr:hypothetical protein BDR26DRAFT_889844 [Obelidium mucronatum]
MNNSELGNDILGSDSTDTTLNETQQTITQFIAQLKTSANTHAAPLLKSIDASATAFYKNHYSSALPSFFLTLQSLIKSRPAANARNSSIFRPYHYHALIPPPKKYITYSLYSNDGISIPEPKFTNGIWNNIKLAQEVFPDWTILIYLPDTMDKNFVNLMKEAPNVEIKEMPFNREVAMFWRFLVADYENVERFLWRERRAVDEWIELDSEMHVMRDGNCHHTYPVMGGMWGAKGSYHPNSTYNEDQNMIRDVLWPVFKDKAVCHDVEPGKMDYGRPYPTLPFPGGNWDRFPNNSVKCLGGYFVGNRMGDGQKTFDCSAGPDVQCKQEVYRSFHLNYMLATGTKSIDADKMSILDSIIRKK